MNIVRGQPPDPPPPPPPCALQPDIIVIEPPKPGEPIPWPLWAMALAKLRIENETGVGDTAERIFGAFGGNAFKLAFRKMFNHECGCDRRKSDWNRLYPYEPLNPPLPPS